MVYFFSLRQRERMLRDRLTPHCRTLRNRNCEDLNQMRRNAHDRQGVSPRIMTKRLRQFLICPGCLGFYHESVKHYIRGDWDGNLGGWRGRRDIGGDWRIFPSEIGRSVYTILLAS